MAKKNSKARKPGGAAGIAVIDEIEDRDISHEGNGSSSDVESSVVGKPARKAKAKPQQPSGENFAVSDIKKAAAFANSIGGLDKAIAVLQILKVAKEVQ